MPGRSWWILPPPDAVARCWHERPLRRVRRPTSTSPRERRCARFHLHDQDRVHLIPQAARVSYEHLVTYIIKAVEAVGIAIMVFGGLAALIAFGVAALDPQRRQNSYDQLRRTFGRCILLGLEVLIVADIVRTVVVDQTFQSVVVLGVIVLIRIVLSFSLDVEIDGTWPWNRRRTDVRT